MLRPLHDLEVQALQPRLASASPRPAQADVKDEVSLTGPGGEPAVPSAPGDSEAHPKSHPKSQVIQADSSAPSAPVDSPQPEPASGTPTLDSPHERFLAGLVPERAALLAGGVWHGEQETQLPLELRYPTNSSYFGYRTSIHFLEKGYTELHMALASEYANRFAVALDGTPYALMEAEKKALQEAGDLYDAGKVAVSEQALARRGSLTEEEAREVARHVLVRTNRFPEGGDPLVEKAFSEYTARANKEGVREIIRHHHEWWDGSGYPDGLKGHDIPLTAQIMGLADTYDALTSRRPWRPGLSHAEAWSAIQDLTAKGQFNPELVGLFFEKVAPNQAALDQVTSTRADLAARLHEDYRWCSLREAQDTEIVLGPGYIAWEDLEASLKPQPDQVLAFEREADAVAASRIQEVERLAAGGGPGGAVQEGNGFVNVGGIRLRRRSP